MKRTVAKTVDEVLSQDFVPESVFLGTLLLWEEYGLGLVSMDPEVMFPLLTALLPIEAGVYVWWKSQPDGLMTFIDSHTD